MADRARAVISAVLLLALATFGGSPLMAQSGAAAKPDCQCRSPDGTRKNLGVVQCVTISGRAWLVRCEMSTNTPYWRRLLDDEGCPAA